MKPSLHWDVYRETGNTLRFMSAHKDLLEMLSTNKRTDIDTIRKAFSTSAKYNGNLEVILEVLRKDEIILEQFVPAEFKNRVDDMVPFYSINWKMIKAINKAISAL